MKYIIFAINILMRIYNHTEKLKYKYYPQIGLKRESINFTQYLIVQTLSFLKHDNA